MARGREQIHAAMSRVRSTGTKIEIKLRKALWFAGIRYRTNVSDIYGHPDIAIKKYKIAIFCDSEFWHGHEFEKLKISKTANKDYWIRKIARNMERDAEVNSILEASGWTIIRFRGKDIQKKIEECSTSVINAIEEAKERMVAKSL